MNGGWMSESADSLSPSSPPFSHLFLSPHLLSQWTDGREGLCRPDDLRLLQTKQSEEAAAAATERIRLPGATSKPHTPADCTHTQARTHWHALTHSHMGCSIETCTHAPNDIVFANTDTHFDCETACKEDAFVSTYHSVVDYKTDHPLSQLNVFSVKAPSDWVPMKTVYIKGTPTRHSHRWICIWLLIGSYLQPCTSTAQLFVSAYTNPHTDAHMPYIHAWLPEINIVAPDSTSDPPHCAIWAQQYSACCLWMSSACCHPSLLHSARSGLCLSHCCLWLTCRRKTCLWCLTVWSLQAFFCPSRNPMPSRSHRPDLAPTPSTMESRSKFNAPGNETLF